MTGIWRQMWHSTVQQLSTRTANLVAFMLECLSAVLTSSNAKIQTESKHTAVFYGQDIHASAIFNGDVEPPPKAYDLYTILQDYTEKYTTDWQNKHMQASSKMSSVPARPRPPTESCLLLHTQGKGFCKCETSSVSNNWNMESSDQASGGALVVTAVHPFTSQQPGDLSFIPGDRITVFTKTGSTTGGKKS
ncbi:hypothetical protein cypCar_00011744 [Cyprinus carpio]|nr:hypothetical protein cypCar_00011744 [Cyprinus carpio]